jgi:exodeoxyribonuclease (lambda-induced)
MQATNTQRTAEWFAARVGCLTASRAAAAINRTKAGKPTADYAKMIDEILVERLTGQPAEHFETPAMRWGTEHEDEAREEYELATGEFVQQTGFVPHPSIAYLGASPDGLVGEDGLIEIKCPSSLTHIQRVRAGVVPDEYKPQMLVQLLCTGRKWVDFVDYDPRLPAPYASRRLFIVRFEPTAEELDDARAKCEDFLENVDQAMKFFAEE